MIPDQYGETILSVAMEEEATMTPPLTIDRGPLVRAKVAKLSARIGQARTTFTVAAAVSAAESDKEIDRKALQELRDKAQAKIKSILEWRKS